jgi:hypothetical protein
VAGRGGGGGTPCRASRRPPLRIAAAIVQRECALRPDLRLAIPTIPLISRLAAEARELGGDPTLLVPHSDYMREGIST